MGVAALATAVPYPGKVSVTRRNFKEVQKTNVFVLLSSLAFLLA